MRWVCCILRALCVAAPLLLFRFRLILLCIWAFGWALLLLLSLSICRRTYVSIGNIKRGKYCVYNGIRLRLRLGLVWFSLGSTQCVQQENHIRIVVNMVFDIFINKVHTTALHTTHDDNQTNSNKLSLTIVKRVRPASQQCANTTYSNHNYNSGPTDSYIYYFFLRPIFIFLFFFLLSSRLRWLCRFALIIIITKAVSVGHSFIEFIRRRLLHTTICCIECPRACNHPCAILLNRLLFFAHSFPLFVPYSIIYGTNTHYYH